MNVMDYLNFFKNEYSDKIFILYRSRKMFIWSVFLLILFLKFLFSFIFFVNYYKILFNLDFYNYFVNYFNMIINVFIILLLFDKMFICCMCF